jgi:hypothetical protein
MTAASCAGASASKPSGGAVSAEGVEEYFIGSVSTTSPDGATPFGPAKDSVARRAISADRNTIEEQVFYGGKLQRTVLTRTPGTSTWAAKDDAGTFSGTINAEGPDELRWTKWTYQIEMADRSGVISGSGERSADGFTTGKLFSAGGAPRAKITETYRTATKLDFEAKLKVLEGQAAPASP